MPRCWSPPSAVRPSRRAPMEFGRRSRPPTLCSRRLRPRVMVLGWRRCTPQKVKSCRPAPNPFEARRPSRNSGRGRSILGSRGSGSKHSRCSPTAPPQRKWGNTNYATRPARYSTMGSTSSSGGTKMEVETLARHVFHQRAARQIAGRAPIHCSPNMARLSAPVRSRYASTGSSSKDSTAEIRAILAQNLDLQLPAHR